MRFNGRTFRSGNYWAIEVPLLDVVTQGYTKKDAFLMIADAIEGLVNRKGFKIKVFGGRNGEFEIGASDEAVLTAFFLKRTRTKAGLTLAEAAARLGSKSPNSYARYEQGRSVPSIRKLSQLYSAGAGGKDLDLVLSKSRI
jgi:predicted RNase H-like HicB family nuclease/DNA-binding XRE family transcriptional regulator